MLLLIGEYLGLVMKQRTDMVVAIVPAYNESSQIGSVVRGLFYHVDTVLVVDDGSTDDTAQLAKEAGAVVVSHPINRGQGASLETGHEWARRAGVHAIVHFDADGQHSHDDVTRALQLMSEHGADMIVGSRYMSESAGNIPWSKRHILHPAARLFHRLVYGIRLSDAHNGFRVLGRRAFHAVEIEQDGMAHATEVVAKASAAQLKMVEMPIAITYNRYGQTIVGAGSVIKDLIIGKFVK